MKKHDKFIAKYDLAVPLVSDEDGRICDAFGTWVEKSMYGRKYMGMERATFLIGANGRVLRAWRKVKVPGHARRGAQGRTGILAMLAPKVSVIVTVYNRAAMIAAAVASLMCQSFGNMEIVVVDDGSTDSSVAVVEVAQGPPNSAPPARPQPRHSGRSQHWVDGRGRRLCGVAGQRRSGSA